MVKAFYYFIKCLYTRLSTCDIMSASEPTCLHDWRAANWIMIVAIATLSTVGVDHDIMSIATAALAQDVIMRMPTLSRQAI